MPALAPEAVADSTRRFLQPLVGIDPASVRVHHAAHDPQLAGLHGLAAGDDIVLAAGHQGQSPQDLGLLAHELTHVALDRDPSFVAPIAGPSTTGHDHEALAQQVEARVVAAATNLRVHSGPAPDAGAPQLPNQVGEPAADHAPGSVDPWGGLPAPWEPLPDWMHADSTSSAANGSNGVSLQDVLGLASGPTRLTTGGSNGHGGDNGQSGGDGGGAFDGGGASSSAAHFAEESRSIQSADSPGAAPQPPAQAQVAPDLDGLAQQVYAILKRRLAAERRRGA
jgi:hypothetical protein